MRGMCHSGACQAWGDKIVRPATPTHPPTHSPTHPPTVGIGAAGPGVHATAVALEAAAAADPHDHGAVVPHPLRQGPVLGDI